MRCICISKKSADYVLVSSFLLIACDYCYSYMFVRPELFLRHSENHLTILLERVMYVLIKISLEIFPLKATE